jgi:hypothetical protein
MKISKAEQQIVEDLSITTLLARARGRDHYEEIVDEKHDIWMIDVLQNSDFAFK